MIVVNLQELNLIIGRKIKEGIAELKNMETNEVSDIAYEELKKYEY